MRYIDAQGRIMEATDGISQGRSWFVGRRTKSGSLRRYKSPACPERATRAEAQADLDAQAKRHGWEAIV